MAEPLVVFEGADIYQGRFMILNDVSVEIFPGEFCYLIGKTRSRQIFFLKTTYGELPCRRGKGRSCRLRFGYAQDQTNSIFETKNRNGFQDFQLIT